MDGVLKHKNILITAPENYTQKLGLLFKKEGAKIWQYPAIKTYINPDLSSLKKQVLKLNKNTLVMLPSRMAIEAFFKAYKQISPQPDLSEIKFFAFGNDQNYLKDKYDISVAYQPEETGPNGIVTHLKSTKKTDKILVLAPKVIGVPEPDVIPNFIHDLKSIGMQPIKIQAYITEANDFKNTSLIKAINQNNLDLICFTSTTEIMALLKAFPLKTIQNIPIACFGPYTGQNAQKLGLKPVYIGQKYGDFKDFIIGIKQLFD
ncbi:MAG TPA: uroporphyrinogen-III synthase [Flavobacteriales bacterium]|nr:uroporphyrinogen-III synthase [Flavobacteriales bacterium]